MGPPIPEGFEVESRGEGFDPLGPLLAAGIEATNGYRTKGDTKRLRAQGYTPADNSDHEYGDGVDLTPGKSGWPLNKVRAFARKQFGPDAKIDVHNGTHVHVSLKGWGQAPGTPGTPRSGLPPVPEGFELEQRGSLKGADLSPKAAPKPATAPSGHAVGVPTGKVQDGDTFGLSSGRNARLYGVDAFELDQQGRSPQGQSVPLGIQSRNALMPFATPEGTVNPTGRSTYGRPVVSLDNGGDAGEALLSDGMAIAAPDYLKGDPVALARYMEAERAARLNRRGAFANTFQSPADHRQGVPDPWAKAEEAAPGERGYAYFADEPTPQQGLRPEIEQGYLAVWNDPQSKPEDLMAYAAANGFKVDPAVVRKRYSTRFKGGDTPDEGVSYEFAPRVLTDPGDGRTGVAMRGFADPINMLDEMGAVVDSVGGTEGRENVWDSDRRFGDILANNLDQNRSILGHDEATHPYYRLGGQLASGVVMPVGGGVRTVGGLIKLGAAEGALAGFGAGEGDIAQRLPNAIIGAGAGAAGGAVLGKAIDGGSVLLGRLKAGRQGKILPDGSSEGVAREAAFEAAPIVEDGAQNIGPTPAARSQGQGGVISSAAMRIEDDAPELVGQVRKPDYLDLGPVRTDDLPPIPAGYVLDDPAVGRTRLLDEQASPADIAAAARRTMPEDVIPVGSNTVASMEEAQLANPGPFRNLEAPDERTELAVRNVPSKTDMFRASKIRGPLDITQRLRSLGGVRDEGGDLAHLGINNEARRMAFGSNEQFLGRLIDNDRGMPLDEAAAKLWEEGYFPQTGERPTVDDLLDRLHQEATGTNRFFHPDDLEEVARFDAAQADRLRIEKAADEGSPLAEDIGQPITQADLDANRPPSYAYEDLPTLGGKVANIDLSKVETRHDIRRALANTEAKFGGFDAARRGKITQAETAALADEMGMTADDLLTRRKGQALNAEQALAARRILAKSGDELVALAQKVRGGSDEAVTAFHRAIVRHAAIQEQVTGATSEAGRALAQFKMMAKSKDHRGRVLQAYIEGNGGRHSIEDAAEAIIDLQKVPGALNKFTADSLKPTWKDKAVELWYNSLLSGPQTHAVNTLSNAMTAGLQLPEHLAAAALGKGRDLALKAFGRHAANRVLMSEIGPRTLGMMQGAREGLKAFKHTLKTGEVSDFVTKVESARQEAISGLKGKVLRVPTRLLSAEDEFFKATARRMELAGLAVRKARGEGLKGKALDARIAELNANPTDEMVERSLDYARYLTFQRPLGPAMRHVQAVVQNHPWLKLFVPFIRTPTNILKFALERSPAAPLLGEVRKSLKAGGADRDLALARIGLGTGLGMMAAQWAASGAITGGGPADEEAKKLMRAGGWQPYSVKVGDRYYSYKRLDPLATTLGVAADMIDLQEVMTERQRAEVVPLLVASVLQNLENKTWLSGMSDVLGVIEDPQRNSHYFVERLAGSIAVPALSAQTARTIDPVARETSSEGYAAGILDAIRNRIPGASKGLLPKRDVFGEEIRNEGGVGPDLASPIWTGTDKRDPVVKEVLAAGATIGPLSRNVGGARLPDGPFNQYQSIAGQLTKQYIEAEIKAPGWAALDPLERKKVISQAKKDARADARSALMELVNSGAEQ